MKFLGFRGLGLELGAATSRVRALVIFLGAGSAAVLFAACQEAAEPLQPIDRNQFIGEWRSECPGNIMQFKDDGSYIFNSPQGNDRGTFSMEGSTVTMVSSAEATMCGAGDEGVWTVGLNSDGDLEFTRVEDPCGQRSQLIPHVAPYERGG